MSLGIIDARKWHEKYESAVPEMRLVIDKAYMAMRMQMESDGLACSNTDAAEEMVACIARYIAQSEQEKAKKA